MPRSVLPLFKFGTREEGEALCFFIALMDNDCKLSNKEFELLKNLMYKETGVFLKPSKQNLVIARLRSRLNALKVNSFEEYYKIITSPNKKNELECFINSITTNETYFFRNESQFNYLKNFVLPEYVREHQQAI